MDRLKCNIGEFRGYQGFKIIYNSAKYIANKFAIPISHLRQFHIISIRILNKHL